MLETHDQQLQFALNMNPDELPIAAEADGSQAQASAKVRSQEGTRDRPLLEPLGMQEASNQVSAGEEKRSLVDRFETEQALPIMAENASLTSAEQRVAELQRREQALRREIATLQASQARLQDETAASQAAMGRLVQEGLKELEQRKQALQVSVEQLERRQERIRNEMKTTFAGVSQDLAIRVQSFKDYLVGSLQDLALAAEQLDLPQSEQPISATEKAPMAAEAFSKNVSTPQFAEQSFQDQTKKIRSLLDQYRHRPDYYGAAWQLRRTFEPVHADRVSSWFFTQGGRGAVRTMGSRLQNILIASATISILRTLYGDRLRALVLAQSPERLGEWRRGLQDCLGMTRSEFGPERGVGLFEDPFPLVQKADRLVKDGLLPLIIIDETEDAISLGLLQFPLWLAFAPNPQVPTYSY